jgi:hypothetical protein
MLSGDRVERVAPDIGGRDTTPGAAAHGDYVGAVDFITRWPIRVADGYDSNVLSRRESAGQVPQGWDAPITWIGTEARHHEAHVHGEQMRKRV